MLRRMKKIDIKERYLNRAKYHEDKLNKNIDDKEIKFHQKLVELYLHLYEKEKLKGEKR